MNSDDVDKFIIETRKFIEKNPGNVDSSFPIALNLLEGSRKEVKMLQEEIVALTKMHRRVIDECIEYRKKEVQKAYDKGWKEAKEDFQRGAVSWKQPGNE